MMKVAVLVYGRLNNCVEHYANIMETIGLEHTVDFFASSDDPPSELLNDFIRLYKPVAYCSDKIVYDWNLDKYEGMYRGEDQQDRMSRHFLNKSRVYDIFKKHSTTDYDVVISLRVDLIFSSKFIFDSIEENTVYIPADFDYGAINDQVAYGTINTMEKYNAIGKNVISLLESKSATLHPETITLANIQMYTLNIVRPTILYRIDKDAPAKPDRIVRMRMHRPFRIREINRR
jgi:hypothetical protein